MTPAIILEATAQHYEITLDDLKGPSRQTVFAHPRMLYCYLSRQHTDASYPQIGRLIGGRDHTTVLHAEQVTKYRLAKNVWLLHDAACIMAIASDLDVPSPYVFRSVRGRAEPPTFKSQRA